MGNAGPEEAHRIADELVGRLTLEQKVGQCLSQSWRGSIVTPSAVALVEKLETGGLRIEPYTTEAAARLSYGRRIDTGRFEAPPDYFRIPETYWRVKHPGFNITAAEYARRLNRLKQIALDRPSGLPLHVCTDFEGDFSHDFAFDGIRLFPAPMGLRAAGPPELTRRVARALGRQLAALGVTMLHSPVLDVNINPENPEINIRAFSDDPEVFCPYAVAFMRGLLDSGIVATAKHFPGRGDSAVDAHHELPVLDADRARLECVELAPYRACIAAGLPAVMVAHNAYPALDSADMPASLSRRIVTDLLRGELGFEGVVTTDAMGMGAIVRRWGVPVASAMALQAGCDLVLLKFDDELRSQSFFEVRRWVREGRLAEADLDGHVYRVLRMKAAQGLFETGGLVDPEAAGAAMRDAETGDLARDVARGAVRVLWDRGGLVPVGGRRLLVIEQMIMGEFVPSNMHYHAHSFSEAVLGHTLEAVPMDTEFRATEAERELALSLLEQVDAVLMTNWYWRIRPENNTALVRAVREAGKPVILVTNNPYAMGAAREADAVVCTWSVTPESLRAAADVLFGKARAPGAWPLEHTPPPG
jgi:beta-N-acetylhexosaminidase